MYRRGGEKEEGMVRSEKGRRGEERKNEGDRKG
jgi:hypothetical protein